MSLFTLVNRLFRLWFLQSNRGSRRQRGRSRRICSRITLEVLEDRTTPSTFYVALTGADGAGHGTINSPFRTIQAGINAAAAASDGNDVIEVEAGTYATPGVDLALNIPNSANLQNLQLLGGFDSSFTMRTPQSTIYIPQQAGSNTQPDVRVDNPNTTIDGFHWVFDGTVGVGGTRESAGISLQAPGAQINNNEIEVGVSDPAGGSRSVGIDVGSNQDGTAITNNLIEADAAINTSTDLRNRSLGIFFEPDTIRTTPVTVSGNTITGSELTSAIVVGDTGLVNITDNTITRTGASTGFQEILLRPRDHTYALDSVNIMGNTLDGGGTGDTGIGLGDIQTATQAITNLNISYNVIENHGIGIDVGISYSDGGPQLDSISGTIQYNSFTGNEVGLHESVTSGSGSTSLDASRNWWDAISGPTSPSNPGGLGEIADMRALPSDQGSALVGISISPWLIYAPDSNPNLPGVQLPTTVDVSAGGDISAADNDFRRLQNAIGAAATGQTIDLSGTFDWTAPFASASYIASSADSTNHDIRGVLLPGGVDNLTITSSAMNAHILGKGDFDSAVYSAFLFAQDSADAAGNTDLTISNLSLNHFEAGFVMGWNSTGVFNGTKIQNNTIDVAGDNGGVQNIAVYLWNGHDQQMTGNTITFEANGTNPNGAMSFGFQNGTTGGTGYDGLLIDNNTFQVLASATGKEIVNGVWENGHNDDNSSHITITHNRFLGARGIHDLDRALLLSSQTDNLVVDSNTFTDVHNLFYSSQFQGLSSGDHFTFTNNVLTRVGGSDGIIFQNVTDDPTPVHVVIYWNTNNTIDGETGVRGLNELSTQATQFHRPHGAATDLNAVIAVGPNPVVFVNAGWAKAGRFTDPDGIGTGVGPVAFGFNDFATIQAGIDAVDNGGTVHVGAGTYVENVLVDKPVSLRGPNAAINPNTGTAVAAAFVIPPANDDYTTSALFTVTASNVSIRGFTISGHNSTVTTGGVMLNGVRVIAAAGITNVNLNSSAVANISGLDVENDIIHSFDKDGIFGDGGGSSVSSGNTLSHNMIDNIPSLTDVGRGINVADNFYAVIQDNVITRARTGIQTNNFNLASNGPAGLIDHNTVTFYVRGLYHNLHYQNATPWTISNNNFTYIPLSATASFNGGLFIEDMQGTASATIENNNVTGAEYGIELWNDPTSNTITVHGGTLKNDQVGVLATNSDFVNGPGAATNTVLDGVTITHAVSAGVRVDDELPAHTPVGLTIQNSIITASPVGVRVVGSGATVTLFRDTISGNSTGVLIADGNLVSASQNFITRNQTGVQVSGTGSIGPLQDNYLAGNTSRAIRNFSTTTIDAEENWWGSTNPAVIMGKVSGNVDTTHFLSSGTDTEPDVPGFQGNLSTRV